MGVRVALGQYLVYAKPWQRALIAVGVIVGGALLLAAGVLTGHVVMAVIGGVLVLGTGNACVQVMRARRRTRPENDTADGPDGPPAIP
jgi:hypothetical protein